MPSGGVGPNASSPSGYNPADLQSAYNLPSSTAGTDHTVAIVDAYDDPNAEADLGTYRSQFGLPVCTTANGCFRKVNQSGGTSYPRANGGWAQEISLDLDMVSAICPNCHILLVEASSSSLTNLGTAVNEAAKLGTTEISNSYGGSGSSSDPSHDSSYYNHPGVAITASSGDSGYGAQYTAASQYVTSVGGTNLKRAGPLSLCHGKRGPIPEHSLNRDRLSFLSIRTASYTWAKTETRPRSGKDRLIAPQFQDWISIFLGILVEATPFLLLGVVVSAFVHVFVSEDLLLRYVPKNPVLSIIPALGIGMLMPVCECGNVAVARRFLAKGVPVSSCIAFLLAAPVLNPVALIATATAFRSEPSMVWLRGGLTFVVAATAGLLIGYWGKGEEVLASGLMRSHEHHEQHGHDHSHAPRGRWSIATGKLEQAANHAGSEFMSMMQVLLFGASVAAASQVLIPRSAITGIGSGVVLGIVAMMSLAFVLSICSTVDAFFALSYSNIFPTPALLAFLVFGPMMSMKGIALMLTAFRPKVVFALATVTVEMVFVAALLLNLKGVLL